MQGGQPDQRGQVLAAQGAQLGQVEPERPRTHRSDPGHAAQAVLALTPDRTRTQGRIEGVITRGHAVIEPRDVRLDIHVEAGRRTPEAIRLSRPHGDALPPSGEPRAPFLRRRVGPWAGFGANRLRKVGQGARIKGLGRGQLASRLRTIAGLTWVDHHDG
jgi:hypothetical protein